MTTLTGTAWRDAEGKIHFEITPPPHHRLQVGDEAELHGLAEPAVARIVSVDPFGVPIGVAIEITLTCSGTVSHFPSIGNADGPHR